MASKNKKNKARNSFIYNGGEKNTIEKWKCRGIAYFTKSDRLLNKSRIRTYSESEGGCNQ